MAYIGPFYRASFFSRIVNSTEEVAQTDVSFSGSLIAGPAPTVALAEDLFEVYVELMTNIQNLVAPYHVPFACKVAQIGATGEYIAEPAYYEDEDPSQVGTGALVPPQASIVISLRSGQTLGKGNYGRMYLPYSGPVQNDGRMTESQANAIAAAGADFVAGVNILASSFTSGAVVRIMSQAAGTPNKVVNTVAAGRVVDTQRRRRSALAEGYSFAPVS